MITKNKHLFCDDIIVINNNGKVHLESIKSKDMSNVPLKDIAKQLMSPYLKKV